jgi:predicted phage-related endonuclease
MTVAALHPYTIGASSVPAILGLDPWDSAYALGARLLDGRDNPSSEAAQMGLDLEAAHAELVAQAGYEVMPAPVAGFVHPDLPWLCVHPDGLLGFEDGIGPLELKLRGVAPSEAIRMRDTVQSLVQVHAMGATHGLVSTIAGGFGGIRRTEFVVTADDEAFGMIVGRLERFLDQLRRGVLPEPDGHDSTRDAIRARYAHAEPGKAVRATQEVWGWVKRIRELREVENTAKEQRQAFEHRVQDYMGDATELVSPFDTPAARWRPVERTSIDTTRLKRDRPEIAGEYAKTTASRRFEANP